MTFEEAVIFCSENRYIGYSSMRVLNTGEIIVAFEFGTIAFNINNSVQLTALRALS